jgi:hypothetical protein
MGRDSSIFEESRVTIRRFMYGLNQPWQKLTNPYLNKIAGHAWYNPVYLAIDAFNIGLVI